MLRRPPTTLTLTAEDVAAYEDRRFASQAQSQSQTQPQSRATSHPPFLQQPQPTAMDTSPSITPSPPPAGDDEDMQDVDADEADTTDPFVTAPRRAARDQFSVREVSPGAARAAYLQQVRATRSQQQQHHPTNTTTAVPAPPTRMQRITGTAQPVGATRTRTATSRQGSTEPSAVPAPTPGPGRMMTRSREERIGVAGSTTGTGGGSRRR
ncbi:hypothetical protein F4781DRAFT_344298 [Annulohypoxylon bovei var. microspora]|nr:hypothetical protein F4781DRAFT_344298 [Annulohypoxylon bovei var. microspora]